MFALLVAQLFAPDCVSSLRLRGSGVFAAEQVAPYADCLNHHLGTVEQLRGLCSEARSKATDVHASTKRKAKVQKAVSWLDDMTRWRAQCETRLTVER